MKFFKVALLSLAALLASGSIASAAITGVNPAVLPVRKLGSFSGTGSVAVPLNGQQSCNITLTGPFVAATNLNVASDVALTYHTSASASTVGQYIVSTASQRSFQFAVTSYTSGAVNYDINCTNAPVPASSSLILPYSGTTDAQTPTASSAVGLTGYNGTTQDRVRTTNGALNTTVQVAGANIDPRTIRALTSADVVSAAQSGTWSASLNAGSALIGKVSTDQTTHGTTDLVAADVTKINGTALGSPTAAGTSASGNVIGVQGVTGGVAVPIATLPSGTNLIGKVSTDQTTHGTSDLVAADVTKINGSSLASPTAPGTGTSGNILSVQGNTSGVAMPVTLATVPTHAVSQSGAWIMTPVEVTPRLLNSSSTTSCSVLTATANIALYFIENANAASQTGVTLTLYDEGVSPLCSTADIRGTYTLTQGQVIPFGTIGKGFLNGIAYTLSTTLATGGPIILQTSK